MTALAAEVKTRPDQDFFRKLFSRAAIEFPTIVILRCPQAKPRAPKNPYSTHKPIPAGF
jgi:hypothetical protein